MLRDNASTQESQASIRSTADDEARRPEARLTRSGCVENLKKEHQRVLV